MIRCAAALGASLSFFIVFAACGGQEATHATSEAGVGADAPLDVVAPIDAGPGDQSSPPDVGTTLDASAEADAIVEAEAGGCDPSTVAWFPSALPGLVLWLDAAAGITAAPGSPVSQWSDQSPAHNNALQPTIGYQPILMFGSIGGLPGVRFNGSQTFLSVADSTTLQWGTGDFALVAVATFSNTNISQMLYQKSPLAAPYNAPALYVNSEKPMQDTTATAQVSEYVFATSKNNGLQGAPHLFTGRRFGSTVEIRVDGASQGQSAIPMPIDVSAPGQPAMIGHNGYNPRPGFQALQGDIAELIAVQGTLADADLRKLECHLLLKYGL
jgi:hypothetical protein